MKITPISNTTYFENVPEGGIFWFDGEFFIKTILIMDCCNAIDIESGAHCCNFAPQEEVDYYPRANIQLA